MTHPAAYSLADHRKIRRFAAIENYLTKVIFFIEL